MKFQILKHRPHYVYIQPIYKNDLDHMLDLVKPDIELGRVKGVLENIQRWEDDGGTMIEINRSAFKEQEKPNA